MKKLVIAGGSGFLGNCLIDFFKKTDQKIFVLSRRHHIDSKNVHYVKWNGEHLGGWADVLENADAIINLAGRSVNCRYNVSNKDDIYDSRIRSTYLLGKAIQQCEYPPKVWINSSSATIYRHSVDTEMNEFEGEIGKGFSVDVCKKWEGVFNSFNTPGVRKVTIRTAIVLGDNSQVLKPLVRLCKIGMGGKQGAGNQYFSWVHSDDFCSIIDCIISDNKMNGVYNVCSPTPVTNKELMEIMRTKLGIPFGVPLNNTLLCLGAKIIGTETELILKSRRVVPTRLVREGYVFRFSNISEALDDLLIKS